MYVYAVIITTATSGRRQQEQEVVTSSLSHPGGCCSELNTSVTHKLFTFTDCVSLKSHKSVEGVSSLVKHFDKNEYKYVGTRLVYNRVYKPAVFLLLCL